MDLNNLRSHQAYYTALLRSATADGTLILQGFDPKHTTGGCSEALRQEFRELELLDDIMRLQNVGKVVVNTRNDLITSFRSWKGNQYVPSIIHKSIKWSTRNTWLESEVLSQEECLALLEKTREKRSKEKCANKPLKYAGKDVTELGIGKPNEQKRPQSSGLFWVWSATSTHTCKMEHITPLQ